MTKMQTPSVRVMQDKRISVKQREADVQFLKDHPQVTLVDVYLQALCSDDFGIRWDAAEALSEIGPTALPKMLEALTHADFCSDGNARRGIERALRTMTVVPEAITQPLIKAFHSPDSATQSSRVAGMLLNSCCAGKLNQTLQLDCVTQDQTKN